MRPGNWLSPLNYSDYNQTKAATLHRRTVKTVLPKVWTSKVPILPIVPKKFEIGKSSMPWTRTDVHIVNRTLGMGSFDCSRSFRKTRYICWSNKTTLQIKLLDGEAVLNLLKKTGCIVTRKERRLLGGLGESISGYLAYDAPYPNKNLLAPRYILERRCTPEQFNDKIRSKTIKLSETPFWVC